MTDRITEIRSIEAPELDIYARDSENRLRHYYEPHGGLFIAESPKVIERALDAGYEPVSFLLEKKHITGEMKEILDRCAGTKVYTAELSVLERITGYKLTRGALCAMRRKQLPDPAKLLEAVSHCGKKTTAESYTGSADMHSDEKIINKNKGEDTAYAVAELTQDIEPDGKPDRERGGKPGGELGIKLGGEPGMEPGIKPARSRVAVIANVENPTNVGAIIRSAAAMGMDAVFLTRDCSDPLFRRAVRVSMGTVFQVPWTYIDTMDVMKQAGYSLAALALSDDSVSLDDQALKSEKRLAIIVGNEGDGLSGEVLDSCDYTVKIPMYNQVDSLNAAAASAVAFWELR